MEQKGKTSRTFIPAGVLPDSERIETILLVLRYRPRERKENALARKRERERRSERTILSVCQSPVGSHSLHNCSELNSSLVAPPEITLLSLSPPPHVIISYADLALSGVYYVLVAALVARSAPTTFVNELGPSSSGFC